MTDPVAIVDVQPSTNKNKRYKAVLNNGKVIHFGLDGGHTYIDHHDWVKRSNYRVRHYASLKEKPLLESLTPSPAVLSMYLLWGPHRDLPSNVEYLNRIWQRQGITGK